MFSCRTGLLTRPELHSKIVADSTSCQKATGGQNEKAQAEDLQKDRKQDSLHS